MLLLNGVSSLILYDQRRRILDLIKETKKLNNFKFYSIMGILLVLLIFCIFGYCDLRAKINEVQRTINYIISNKEMQDNLEEWDSMFK